MRQQQPKRESKNNKKRLRPQKPRDRGLQPSRKPRRRRDKRKKPLQKLKEYVWQKRLRRLRPKDLDSLLRPKKPKPREMQRKLQLKQRKKGKNRRLLLLLRLRKKGKNKKLQRQKKLESKRRLPKQKLKGLDSKKKPLRQA